jgi:hypothetical protein
MSRLWPSPDRGITKNDMPWIFWLAVSALRLEPSVPPPDVVRVHVQWQAPSQCPAQPHVERLIERLSDAIAVPTADADVDVRATVTPTVNGFAAEVELRTGAEVTTRRLAADDCALLSRAVALVTAVALDPVVVAGRVEAERAATTLPSLVPEPAPADEPDEPDEPVPAPPPEAPAAPRERLAPRADAGPSAPPPRIEAGARLGFGIGGLILPRAGAGLSAAPFVGGRRVHAELALQYWTPRTVELGGGLDAGASFQLVSVGLRGCPILTWGRWRFVPCAGVDGGALVGSGRGSSLARSQRVTTLWAAAIVRAGGEVRVAPRVSLFVAFEGAISLNRPEFHLDLADADSAGLHQVGAFGPRGRLGVVLHRPFS